jgi:hypothetical protein
MDCKNKNSLQNTVLNVSEDDYFECLKIYGMVTLKWIAKKQILKNYLGNLT